MVRQERADAEQLGEVWCRAGRKQRCAGESSLMCRRKEEEEEPLSREKGRRWDKRLKGGKEGRGETEMEASNSDKMD